MMMLSSARFGLSTSWIFGSDPPVISGVFLPTVVMAHDSALVPAAFPIFLAAFLACPCASAGAGWGGCRRRRGSLGATGSFLFRAAEFPSAASGLSAAADADEFPDLLGVPFFQPDDGDDGHTGQLRHGCGAVSLAALLAID